MSEEYLLGIDVGTLAVKGSLVNLDGDIISSDFIEHDILTPKPGWSEQDPERHWWHDTVKVIRNIVSSANVKVSCIKAIGVSGLFPDMCPLDEEGKPLRNAILYSDNRSLPETKYLNRIYNWDITTEEMISKVLWFMRNEPEKFRRTKMILNAPNYVVYKLTNVYSMDYLLASFFGGVYDDAKKEWREEILKELKIPLDILPPTYPSIEVIGTITDEASKATGLKEGTPVIVGTGDAFTTMLSSTIIDPGDTLIYYGTAGLCIILSRSLRDLFLGNYDNLRECLFQATYVLTTGEFLKWFISEFLRYESIFIEDHSLNIYEILDNKASNIPPGSNGLLIIPYLRGERTPKFNPDAKGVIFGLTIHHTLHHIYRAILESFGYMVRLGIEQARDKKIYPKRLIASGGGAKSALWRHIISDILNMPQEYVKNADASIGSAFLAGLGVKLLKDVRDVYRWAKHMDVTYPRPQIHEKYETLYQEFLKLHNLLFGH
ncbi:MAG: hypothetical protein DRN49_00545 [Thaumarchaeota archaeon]|nr:MAG: hypothetical protein DRN49_00545 [Nitrososphaerota archaeon]